MGQGPLLRADDAGALRRAIVEAVQAKPARHHMAFGGVDSMVAIGG